MKLKHGTSLSELYVSKPNEKCNTDLWCIRITEVLRNKRHKYKNIEKIDKKHVMYYKFFSQPQHPSQVACTSTNSMGYLLPPANTGTKELCPPRYREREETT